MDAEVLKKQGEALMNEQRVAEAVVLFGQATKAAPDDEGAHVRLGIAHSILGQKEQALQAFETALALNPQSVVTFYNRSGLKRYQAGDPELAVLEALLGQEGALTLEQIIMAHFTLGKAWMDVGDGAKAFEHYHRGNGLKRRTMAYDFAGALSVMERIPSYLTAENIEALKVGGDPSTRPIFIVGMPRSGSTLVEQVLASHSHVAGAGEITAFKTILQGIRQNGTTIPFPDVVQVLSPPLMGQIGGGYLHVTQRWVEEDKPRLTDKYLDNFLYAGMIHACLPHAKIIHCRRNALDTCLSCYTTLFGGEQDFTFNMQELGLFWRAYDRLMTHWRAVLPPSHFIEVEYEEMVADLPQTTRTLLKRLDLPWQDACLTFYDTARPVLTASNQQVRQPIYAKSVGRWKAYAEYIGPLIEALG